MIKKLLIATCVASTAFAADFRLIGGTILPNNAYLDNSRALGFEIEGLSTVRESGLFYSMKTNFIATNTIFDKGSFADLNIGIGYRKRRTTEFFINGGTTYQKLDNDDYGFGYNVGIGMRYVWCSGYMLGIEFNGHELKYKSGNALTAALDGEKYRNHNILISFGYRVY